MDDKDYYSTQILTTTLNLQANKIKGDINQLLLYNIKKQYEGEIEMEIYVQAKIYGQGRKHFIKRNNEKTKVIWIQERLVSKCRDEKEKET